MGAFPNLSCLVPSCPRLSSYRENAHPKSANFEGRHSGGHLLGRPLLFTSEDKRGQNGTEWDKLGMPPFSIYPHLALYPEDLPRGPCSTKNTTGSKSLWPYPLTQNYYLQKNYSEIIIFRKITNLTRNSSKMSFFLDIWRGQNS